MEGNMNLKIKTGIYAIILLIEFILLTQFFFVEEIILIFILIPILINSLSILIKKLFKKPIIIKRIINRELRTKIIVDSVLLCLIIFLIFPRYYTKQEIGNDLDYLIETIEDVHPNLYDYITREEFHSEVTDYKNSINDKVTEMEFYRGISKLLALVKDGHTRTAYGFYGQRMRLIFLKVFPYKIKIQNNRIFVIDNYNYKNRIPAGSEILKINDLKPDQIIREVSKYCSYENNPFRNRLITDPKEIGLWNNFKDYIIVYKNPQNNKIVTIHSSSGFISKFLLLKDMTADYAFKTIDKNIGYLVFNRFEKPEKSRQFINHTFDLIKKEGIKDLIIDMRNNEGGRSIIGDELMQYIAKKPFSVMNSMETKISKELVAKKYKSWLESKKESIGTIEKYTDMDKKALKDIPLRFNGNCFLLISGRTYSAGSGFASAFQCANIGKVIGSETGGLTVTYGDVYRFKLPKTKCPIDVSWKKFYYPCGEENRRGVMPDIDIENSIEDEIKSRDRVLEYVIKLING